MSNFTVLKNVPEDDNIKFDTSRYLVFRGVKFFSVNFNTYQYFSKESKIS